MRRSAPRIHAHAPRREAVNLSVDARLLAEARELGVPLSAAFEAALVEKVREARRAAWLRQNTDAITDFNARVEADGVFSDGLRRF